jgi:hypothetical protein
LDRNPSIAEQKFSAAWPRLFPEDSTEPGPSWRRGVALAVLICLATRIVVWSAAYAGASDHVRIRNRIEGTFDLTSPTLRKAVADPASPLGADIRCYLHDLSPLMQWDAGHYRSVVMDGYSFRWVELQRLPREDAQFNIAFFPGYPLLCAMLAPLVGVATAMVGVANVAAVLAAVVLYIWARRLLDHSAGLLCVTLIFTFPTACFYSFGYAESLTLLLIAGSLCQAQQGRWGWAAAFCAAASACRPTALLLAPLLAVVFWRISAAPRARRFVTAAAIWVASSLGAAAFLGYLAWRFGSPMVYAHNLQVGWLGSDGVGDWTQVVTLTRIWRECRGSLLALATVPSGLGRLSEPSCWAVPLAVTVCAFSIAALARVPRWFRPLLWLGPLIFLQRYLTTAGAGEQHVSLARYVAIAVPPFIVLAVWMLRKWPWPLRTALLTFFTLLQASWAFHYGRNDWTG